MQTCERQRSPRRRDSGLEMRRHEESRPDRAGDPGHLERRREQHSLSDGHLREVAGIPLLAVRAQLPLSVRHDACGVRPEVESGSGAESERARGRRQRVRSGVHPEVAEERIAALHHGMAEIQRTVTPRRRAAQTHAAKLESAAAFVFVGGGASGGQSGERRHGLERGAGRVHPRAGAVEQRLGGVAGVSRVRLAVKHRHEIVEVEPRRAGEREDVAVPGIDDRARPGKSLKLPLGLALHAHVQGQPQIRAGLRGGDRPLADREPARVHKHLALAGHSAQEAVVVRLQPGASAHLRREEIELFVAGLRLAAVASGISDHVRRDASRGILALDGLSDLEAREVGLVLREHGQLPLVNVPPRRQRHGQRLPYVATDAFRRYLRRASDLPSEPGRRRFDADRRVLPRPLLKGGRTAHDAGRYPVVGKHLSVPVDDPSAHSGGLHTPHGLPYVGISVVGGVLDLKIAESHAEPGESGGEHDSRYDARGATLEGNVILLHREPPFLPPSRGQALPRTRSRRRSEPTREPA